MPPLSGQGPDDSTPRRFGDQMLDRVFEQAPLGMVLFDREMRIVRANTAFAEMLATEAGMLVNRSLVELTHPDDRARSDEALERLRQRQVTWVTIQQRCLRDDRSSCWGEFATRIFWGPSGEFAHALAIVRDVSESVRAEVALRESELRNWRISESNIMGMFEWQDATTISEANDAFLQMIGYSRDELRTGRIRWTEILPPGHEALTRRMRDELLSTGRIRPIRIDYQTKTGVRIPVLAGGARISWEPIRGIGFVLDMSEQRKIEDERAQVEIALRDSLAELRQTQARLQLADRLASMGTLAAGVAHEINNPLSFVVANLGFAQEELAALRAGRLEPDELEKRLGAFAWALAEAQEGANRVRNIVLDLKMFSHPDTERRTAVDLCRVIDSALNLAQGEIRGRARVVRRFARVPRVLGNEARLSQLFLNLIVNAAHSIPTGGEGAPAPAGGYEIGLSVDLHPDGRVKADVTDNGVGIPADHLARIFDPFFTTKPVGLGTGLGLSICHGIVHSLGGEITAASTLGAGSTFHVLLPAAGAGAGAGDDPSPEPPAADPKEAGRVPRRARVLVVDDEPLMGSAIQRVLAEHDVMATTSARTAMAKIAAGERYDVILCDIMMPDFSGIDLYEGIARTTPELLGRVVFVTGGAFTAEATEFLERVPNPRLEKPIHPDALHEAVAEMLGSGRVIGG